MKSTYRQYLLALVMGTMAAKATAQDLNSAYFTQDYKYRHQMNAAFGNDQSYFSIPVLGNVNAKMQGNFGLGDVLFKNPESGYYNYTFMHPDVPMDEALAGFNKDKNRLGADLNVTILSTGFKAFGGYNVIDLRSRTNVGVSLPYNLFEFAKNLDNRYYEFGDMLARAQSFVELGLGHSRQITDDLRLGAKVKLLFGIGRADLSIKGMKANLTGDVWTITSGKTQAEVNMKGIQFKNTTDDYERGGVYEHVDFDETDIDGGGIGGFGFGLDLGGEYKVTEGLTVSAAINDLGFINWSNNYQLRQLNSQFTFEGFKDIEIKDGSGGVSIDDQADSYKDQLSDFVNLQNTGNKGAKSTMLAATANVGVEYALPNYDCLSFGLLGQHHFAGDYSWTEGRLSANWSPLSWLNGGVNVGVNTFCASAGWVLNIHPAGFNIFLGMDHILGKQSKEFIPLSSNANFVIGMNVAWGGSKKKDKEEKVSKAQVVDEW